MPFIRTRIVKGRSYRSLEFRWREGKRVRSKSIAISGEHPVGAYMDLSLADMAKAVELYKLKEQEKAAIAPPSSSHASPPEPARPEEQSPAAAPAVEPSPVPDHPI
jgi:hypothetical protein